MARPSTHARGKTGRGKLILNPYVNWRYHGHVWLAPFEADVWSLASASKVVEILVEAHEVPRLHDGASTKKATRC